VGPHPNDVARGERLGYARAATGGTPPPAAADVGPEAQVQVVTSEFSEAREHEREAVKDGVRAAGQEPDEVHEQAGPTSREFPSRTPDHEPDGAGNSDKDSDG
jgi:hypothetical protein